MEISIKWNVCRVCMQEETANASCSGGDHGTQMRQIFNDEKLLKQIYECSGVLMKSNDGLPGKICRKCLTNLKCALNFRTTCRNSDDYLQSVIQKTRSATSMFKLDKRREEALGLVDDVIEEIFEDDDTHEEAGEKRKRILHKSTALPMPVHKKNKIGTISEVQEEQDSERMQGTKVGSILSNSALRHESNKCELIQASAQLLQNKIDAAFSEDEDNAIEVAVFKVSLSEVNEMDIKNETNRQNVSDSECSIDGSFIITDVTDDSQGSKQQSQTTENVLSPLPTDDLQQHHLAEECEMSPQTTQDRQFFYILADDIKCESRDGVQEDLEVITKPHFIETDEETKSEHNANAVENVEYLLDSAEENSQVEDLECRDLDTADTAGETKRVRSRKSVGEVHVYVCDICGNHFTNRNLLNFHMKIHRNEKTYECELCYKRFNAACNLSAHMRIHTGEKPFECQFCNRRFADRSTHIKHERIHTNEKPYTCGTCGKAFSLSTSLKAHEKIHTGEKPYRCEPCAKAFKLPHQLKAHLNTHLHKLLTVDNLQID